MKSLQKPFLIKGPKLCLENELTEPSSHGLLCAGGRIQKILNFNDESLNQELNQGVNRGGNQGVNQIGANLSLGLNVDLIEFPADYVLLPGFIDLHVHGADGADFMDGTSEALHKIGAALLREGSTGFLATTMTESPEKIIQSLKNMATTVEDSKSKWTEPRDSTEMVLGALSQQFLGVHLEGPFLAHSRMGAQCGEKILDPNLELFETFYAASAGKIKVVTLAPEAPGALDFIQDLVAKGVVVSIGHTDATFDQAQKAIDAGASYATHLFNAMRGIHHREPGCACAILMDDRVSAELIADGVHLHPDMVKFAVHVKGVNKVILVTDAMRAQCLGDGIFELGGQRVEVKNKEARLSNGVLAGSVLTLREALLNAKKFTGLNWVELSRLTSANPAKIAGCFYDRGSLSIGKRADFVVLSPAGEICATFLAGNRMN